MTRSLWLRLKILLFINLVMIVIHIINIISGMALNILSVFPRNIEALPYILSAPFIHRGWLHLLNNLVGLTIFSSFCLLGSVRYYLASSFFIIIVSGLLVWLFGRGAYHLGASGWIFGLWSLCICNAWYNRNLINIVISIVVIVYYGGMIHGVLPKDPAISFEYHLSGVIAGFLFVQFDSHLPRKLKKHVV